MSTMTAEFIEHPLHAEDYLNLDGDADGSMVDPQLAMPYFGHLDGKAQEQLTIDPTMWSTPMDNPTTNFGDMLLPPGDQDETAEFGAERPPAPAGKTSRTSSKSSVPSLSSGSSGCSSPRSKRARKPTEKATAAEPAPKVTKKAKEVKETKPEPKGRKKQKKQEPIPEEYDEEDSKRTKYLERNRIAASKCRQKKKEWVTDLEKEKSDLEVQHGNLQHEHTMLLDQVTRLKNDLMCHAGCGDGNIDQWIETEAKKFVQRTTDRSGHQQAESRRRMSSCSMGRLSSMSDAGNQLDPINQLTPNENYGLSPIVKKEEINYDHMPDDMFD